MKVQYLGHSGFLFEDLVIDPFMKDNPKCEIDPDSLSCNIICVTHDHFDHIADVERIARKNNAIIVAIFEVAQSFSEKGFETVGMNLGGSVVVGDWVIKMVEAKHSCNLGHPAGFILTHRPSGTKIYHAGDTSLFLDMGLLSELELDVYCVPIGDVFTMGIEDAVRSVELVRPKIVIPMHYNTFPPIKQNPEDFGMKCEAARILRIGEHITL